MYIYRCTCVFSAKSEQNTGTHHCNYAGRRKSYLQRKYEGRRKSYLQRKCEGRRKCYLQRKCEGRRECYLQRKYEGRRKCYFQLFPSSSFVIPGRLVLPVVYLQSLCCRRLVLIRTGSRQKANSSSSAHQLLCSAHQLLCSARQFPETNQVHMHYSEHAHCSVMPSLIHQG